MKLNIGCGHEPLPGYTNVDKYAEEADTRFDVLDAPGSAYEGRFEEILCSHMLEHISWRDVPTVLERFREWLKPEGRLIVEVPDMGRILQEAMHNPDWIRYIWGSQEHEGEYHRTGFTVHSLTQALEHAGFDIEAIQTFRSTNPHRTGMPCIKAECVPVPALVAA